MKIDSYIFKRVFVVIKYPIDLKIELSTQYIYSSMTYDFFVWMKIADLALKIRPFYKQ